MVVSQFLSRLLGKDSPSILRRADKAFLDGRFGEATALWRKSADAADPEACFRLGEAYEQGKGVVQNFADAVTWFERAASAGHLLAQVRLGEIFLYGRGIPPLSQSDAAASGQPQAPGTLENRLFPKGRSVAIDYAAAARWNSVAAAAGNATAQMRLAYQSAGGYGLELDTAAAEFMFMAAAAQGEPAAEFGLAMLYANRGEDGDAAKAVEWLTRASDHGNIPAKFQLGIRYLGGNGADADPERGAALVSEAASNGHIDAMLQLGQLYRFGVGVEIDLSLAETWLNRAAAKGSIPAVIALGRLLIGLDPPDYTSAAILLRQAADLGNPEGQYLLGQLYLTGRGLPLDRVEAERWLRKAASQGVVDAFESLGVLFMGADSEDYAAAAGMFDQGAALGSPGALFRLGVLHQAGLGVPRDTATATAYFRHAAELGHAEACLQLGLIYATGESVTPDMAEAAAWYSRAAEHGSTNGLWNLAFLYIRGLGVQQDIPNGLRMLEALGTPSAAWALHNLYSEDLYIPVDEAMAGYWLERAADLGAGLAACKLAQQAIDKHPNSLPAERIEALLQKAARLGEANAQAMLGRMLSQGLVLKRDRSAGLAWLVRAAQGGSAFAQAWLGDLLWKGDGVAADPAAAKLWYGKAAQQGHTGALTALTQAALSAGGDPVEMAQLLALWTAAAEGGDPQAQLVVGDFWRRGIGTTASAEEAEKWLRRAAAQNHAAGQLALAVLLLQSGNDNGEFAQAAALLNAVAGQGSAEGQYNLGVLYNCGTGVAQDTGKARALFLKAAEQGQASAQLALGDVMLEAAESDAERSAAVHWYGAAAEKGVPAAMHSYGRAFELGQGVGKNQEMALSLYRRAAEAGYAEALKSIERLEAGPPTESAPPELPERSPINTDVIVDRRKGKALTQLWLFEDL